jgi:hypothetical protein
MTHSQPAAAGADSGRMFSSTRQALHELLVNPRDVYATRHLDTAGGENQ